MSGQWILVVDDDEDVSAMLQLTLELAHLSARGARDGIEALERIREFGLPALILLDLRMPRLNGEELLKTLRLRKAFLHVPIVIVSGDNAAASHWRELGATAFVRKPVDPDELIALATKLARGETASTLHP
jgi:CheY-like chemotaxis protein